MIPLLALLALAVGLSLLAGSGSLADVSLRWAFIELRGWRTLAASLAGGALAVAGVLVQALFRNPLAEPGILGVGAGAFLGIQLAMVAAAGGAFGLAAVPVDLLAPLAATVGGGLALAALLAFGRHADAARLLLAGVAWSLALGAAGALLLALVQDDWQLARALLAFGFGHLTGTGPGAIAASAPLAIVGIAAAWCWARPLDLLLSGREEASALGLDTAQAQSWLVVWVSVLTAAAVSLAGNLIFVALVVPHLLRLRFGAGHPRLIPAAAVGGAAFTVFCDTLARCWPGAGELPLGAVTALLGVPVFLWLLARQQTEAA